MRTSSFPERMSLNLLAFLVAFAGTALDFRVLGDGDTWWHLGAGRWIVEHLAIPTTDPFSHSNPGIAWHAHEWGADVLMWLAYRGTGPAGLIALTGIAAGVAAALLADFLQRHLRPAIVIVATMAALMCLLPSVLARPHLLALPLFVVWVAALLKAREQERAPPLPLAALMTVWANLHGSFLLGLVLVAPLALEALIAAEDRKKTLTEWAAFGLLAIAAALVTPFGIAGFLFPLQVSALETLQLIGEWQSTTVANSPAFVTVALATIAVLLALGVRFPPLRALIYVGLLLMAFSHRRHQFVFGIIGWLFAAEPLGRATAKAASGRAEASRADWVMLASVAAASLAALVLRVAVPVGIEDRHNLPLALIERVPPELRGAPVFNEYSLGGPLIFAGIRPFIDGRADMYGDDFIRRYRAANFGEAEAWDRIARRYDIKWTLLRPGSDLIELIERRGWRRILADDRAVVHVRPASNPAGNAATPSQPRR